MSHSFAALYNHFVFSTKHRAPIISVDIRDHLYRYMSGIISNKGCQMIIIGGMPDHVHILVRMSRDISPSSLVNAIKANSSKMIRADNPSLSAFEWQTGYGVFTASWNDRDKIYNYIVNQEEHHRTLSHGAEIALMMRRCGEDSQLPRRLP